MACPIRLRDLACVQHGRCRNWNAVFDELAFDSTLGYPGEGPTTSKSIFDFFDRLQSDSAAAEPATEEPDNSSTAAPTVECTQPKLQLHELPLPQLLLLYTEEVLCNVEVSGSGVRERRPDQKGRLVLPAVGGAI